MCSVLHAKTFLSRYVLVNEGKYSSILVLFTDNENRCTFNEFGFEVEFTTPVSRVDLCLSKFACNHSVNSESG